MRWSAFRISWQPSGFPAPFLNCSNGEEDDIGGGDRRAEMVPGRETRSRLLTKAEKSGSSPRVDAFSVVVLEAETAVVSIDWTYISPFSSRLFGVCLLQ